MRLVGSRGQLLLLLQGGEGSQAAAGCGALVAGQQGQQGGADEGQVLLQAAGTLLGTLQLRLGVGAVRLGRWEVGQEQQGR
jgi:hypothetical protein